MPTTFADLKTYVRDNYGDAVDAKAVRVYERLINRAFRWLAKAYDWSFYQKDGRVNFVALQETGTVAITKDTATLTLTGATWPTDAATAPWYVVLNANRNVEFEVLTRTSGTIVVFQTGQTWLDATETASKFQTYRRSYAMPTDFRKYLYGQPETSFSPYMVSPAAYTELRLANQYSTGDPRFFTIIGSAKMLVWPAPTTARVFAFVYSRWPTAMTADGNAMDFPEEYLDVAFAAIDVEIARSWTTGPVRLTDAIAKFEQELRMAQHDDSERVATADTFRLGRRGRRFGHWKGWRNNISDP